MTLPQGPRACSTAAMVDGSSHSANASLVLGGSAADADSGFSLYVRPMRMWSRLTSPQKRPLARSRKRNALSRSEEHTSELQSHSDLVCRLLLEKKKKKKKKKKIKDKEKRNRKNQYKHRVL